MLHSLLSVDHSVKVPTLKSAVKKYVFFLTKLWRHMQGHLEILNGFKLHESGANFCSSLLIFYALFFVVSGLVQFKQFGILHHFVAEFAHDIPILNFIAAGNWNEFLGFYLFLELLEIQVLITKNLVALNRLILESHHACPAIIDNIVSIGYLRIVLLLLDLNLLNLRIEYLKHSLATLTRLERLLFNIERLLYRRGYVAAIYGSLHCRLLVSLLAEVRVAGLSHNLWQ
jgi:hypothetical protein